MPNQILSRTVARISSTNVRLVADPPTEHDPEWIDLSNFQRETLTMFARRVASDRDVERADPYIVWTYGALDYSARYVAERATSFEGRIRRDGQWAIDEDTAEDFDWEDDEWSFDRVVEWWLRHRRIARSAPRADIPVPDFIGTSVQVREACDTLATALLANSVESVRTVAARWLDGTDDRTPELFLFEVTGAHADHVLNRHQADSARRWWANRHPHGPQLGTVAQVHADQQERTASRMTGTGGTTSRSPYTSDGPSWGTVWETTA